MKLSETIRTIVDKIRWFIPVDLWNSLSDETDEVAKLEAENVVLRNGLLGCAEWSHDKIPLNEAAEVLDALLTGEESEHE